MVSILLWPCPGKGIKLAKISIIKKKLKFVRFFNNLYFNYCVIYIYSKLVFLFIIYWNIIFKKNTKCFMEHHNIIYSTDNSYFEEKDGKSKSKSNNLDQKIRLHLDRKKGGKTITVIKGFKIVDDQIKALVKKIKIKCASGGSIKNNEIIIQGNKRDIIKAILEKEGYKPKLSGG